MTDTGMQVSVVAERPETIELMRRFSSILTDDLRSMGYDALDLSFSHNGEEQHREAYGPREGVSTDALGTPEANIEQNLQPRPSSGRIDIRV